MDELELFVEELEKEFSICINQFNEIDNNYFVDFFSLNSADYTTWRLKVKKHIKTKYDKDDNAEILKMLDKTSISYNDKENIIGGLNFLRKQPLKNERAIVEGYGKEKKPKLEKTAPTFYIYNQNQASANVDMQINIYNVFESAKQSIEKSASLNEVQIKEALEKLNEIKLIILSKEGKETIWSKLGKFIIWTLDKAADVGIAFLTAIASGMSSLN
ncbi:MAG: hypothetical protein PHH71_01250 [Clostridia bacterium]|jgi:hypothetical protein|nr:hypothetical protein [Clostridia bacterium]MDD3232286.1 hypothetical protein [Clostridia bacterium]MDD3862788.1 hypothetical protein [Clostridia bacterium]MDD4408781.1 hypothetical protein [Clostridia bacterium]